MSTTPRIIAASASAALLAATGAGAAVFAVETVTAGQADAATTTNQQSADTLGSPKDGRTTVYRSQGQGGSQQNLQQAPPSTSWNGGSQAQQPQQQLKTPNKAGKSHSS